MQKAALFVLFCSGLAAYSPLPAAPPSRVAQLVAEMTWSDPDQGRARAEQLVSLGPPAVVELVSMLRVPGAPGKGDDANVRFALHGMVVHAARPGRGPAREALSAALLQALDAEPEPELKAFLIAQIQLIGSDAAMPVLVKYQGIVV